MVRNKHQEDSIDGQVGEGDNDLETMISSFALREATESKVFLNTHRIHAREGEGVGSPKYGMCRGIG